MSSLLSRKKRTGETSTVPVAYNPNPSNNPKSSGLTLPQVINVIDNRLIALETFMKESKQNPVQISTSTSTSSPTLDIDNIVSNDFMNEIQSRYEILAQEISDLKDIIIKLQTYTMDVNKTLLEERIHILSDLGDSEKNETSLLMESNDV
jgi:hypothetical protein